MEFITRMFSKKKQKIYIGFEDLKYAILTLSLNNNSYISNAPPTKNVFHTEAEYSIQWDIRRENELNKIKENSQYIIISTLSTLEQDCLIYGTTASGLEEHIINSFIDNGKTNIIFILYGKNAADDSVHIKRDQLVKLGFDTVYIYGGGLFEWFLLQDIYGFQEFPTTAVCRDFLKYRAPTIIQKKGIPSIEY